MGKIVVKAQQQNVFNKDKSGVKSKAYVLRPVRYTTMNSNDIVNYCAANSIVPKAYLSASMVALSQCIENFLLNGHSVEFPNLGIFSLSSKGISEEDANKAGIAQLTKLNVRFLPCTQLKTEVENVDLEFDGVYDIAGENSDGEKYYRKVVRKLTATDTTDGDDEGDDTNGGSNSSSGSNGSQNQNPNGQYTINVTSANTAQGTVTGGGTFTSGSRIQIVATPKSGYAFDKWSDGNTSATRQITVSQNLNLTASFKVFEQGGGTDQSGEDDNQSSVPEF